MSPMSLSTSTKMPRVNESPTGQVLRSEAGMHATLAPRWQRMPLLLVLAGVLLGVVVPTVNAGGFYAKKPSTKSAQLLCAGTVRYQFGKNAWARQKNGNIPVILPISIQTDNDLSQLIVPKMGVFQANANTRFTLSVNHSQQFQLSIQQGAVFYSLTSGASLRITSPLQGVGANVAGPEAGSTSGAWSSLPDNQFVGQTSFDKENFFQLVNMNGRAQVDRNGWTIRNVGQGRTLSVSLAPRPDLVTTGTATRAGMANRGYVFQETAANRNASGVLQPMSSNPSINTPKFDGFGGGGFIGLGRRDGDRSNEPASPSQ